MNNNLDITYKELDIKDLCYEGINDENLYDSDSIEEFEQEIIDKLEECDESDFKRTCDWLIKKSNHLIVYEKDYFYVTDERIQDYIQDYADDNFGTSYCDYNVQYSDKANKLLSDFLEEINKDNKIYTTGASVGFIDMSKEVKHIIKDYCDENPIVY